MKRFFVGALTATVILSVALISEASAHVLVRDTTGTKGAILHVVPDDDPIAGEPSTLFFDAQNNLITAESEVHLTITSEEGDSDDLLPTKNDSLVTASYTFPVQGVYTVAYAIRTADTVYEFKETLRVSRGAPAANQAATRYAWAEGILIGVGSVAVALGIIAWSRRKEIADYSKL